MKPTSALKWLVLLFAFAVPTGASAQPKAAAGDAKRGEYLVKTTGCHDCHTPMKMGQKGLEPDMTRMLSGHPESLVMPPSPKLQSPWMAAAAMTFTAWSGPWGTSFASNLTPDLETGLGKWTQQDFVLALKTGKHMGRGRAILPPMPWPALSNMTDQDLQSMYAYLKTIPPMKNMVPNPRLPETPAKAPPPAAITPGKR
ncbi:MAG: c-type cytochrome [Myxococcaceae bacterium]